MSKVISLVLPNNQLLGSIPPDLFFIEHLKHVDLSNNIFNGTLPSSLFLNSSGLQAVLEDGSVFAVKRLGEVGVEKRKEFESVMRGIGKLRHPNLVRVRGFYWGDDEKLVICDYVSNGCLANISYRKVGSSPSHLPFKVRLRIARGIARGLAYIHEKKHVHGNLKPSNILLDSDMEPVIGDLGLNCLAASSGHRFESKSCSGSHDAISNVSIGGSPYGAPNGSVGFQSPYYAPESLKSLKPNPRWDVYSFGIILLELLTGRVFLDKDLAQLTSESTVDEKNRVVRMADVAIRAEMADNEDTMLACFKLGLSCACIVPQKRPTTKEALLVSKAKIHRSFVRSEEKKKKKEKGKKTPSPIYV
ncbi:Protein kinase domain [Dillenia turbinata]|uniref:Protein kinase domain n=1 Tax=Dillenia turbinata TaxID=194707 RepID=A0AAN8UP51_9MAGN